MYALSDVFCLHKTARRKTDPGGHRTITIVALLLLMSLPFVDRGSQRQTPQKIMALLFSQPLLSEAA